MQFTIFNTKKKRVKFVFIHNSHIHFFNNDNIKFINGIDMQIKLYYNTCIFALITIVDPLFTNVGKKSHGKKIQRKKSQ
jgi:hypothetical protein